MRKEAIEVRNLAHKMKNKLKFKKIKFKKGDDEYEAVWKGFGKEALKFEIYLRYDDLLDNKDKREFEKEIWERLNGEYRYREC